MAQAAAYDGDALPLILINTTEAGTHLSMDEGADVWTFTGFGSDLGEDEGGVFVDFGDTLYIGDEGYLYVLSSTYFLSEILVGDGGALHTTGATAFCADVSVLSGATLTLEDPTMVIGIDGSLEVSEGATLEVRTFGVYGGAWLSLDPGSVLSGVDGGTASIVVLGSDEDSSEGNLVMNGVDLNGVTISCEGYARMTGCYGKGTLSLTVSNDESFMSITGCDLSQVTIRLNGDVSSGGYIDLSGNYWGTTNVTEIKSMIEGYDDSFVYLGEILSSAPEETPSAPDTPKDTTPPALTLQAPGTKKTGNGETQVTFNWNSDDAGASYTLTVDGKDYSVSGTTYTLTLKDGSHSWSVTATDAAGNSATAKGDAFTLDATPPTLTLKTPQVQAVDANNVRVTLSWSAEGASSYEVKVDGVSKYSGKDSSCVLTLTSGKHSYSVTATDASGNSVSKSDEAMMSDTVAPKVTLQAPSKKTLGNGRSNVTFSWQSNENATYVLTVDGLTYAVVGTSHDLVLEDGKHSWSVKATDVAGNASTQTGTAFELDSTAPTLRYDIASLTPVDAQHVRLNLSWVSNGGVSYVVKVDGKTVQTLTQTSCELLLSNARHDYSVTALDAFGNEFTLGGEAAMANTSAPQPLLQAPIVKVSKGKSSVTFKWLADGATNYRLEVDGLVRTDGKKLKWKGKLTDGLHSYKLTSTNAAGVTSTLGGEIYCDATAPQLIMQEPIIAKVADGSSKVTLRWDTHNNEDAIYTVTVDKREVYTGSVSNCVVDLVDGKHSYVINAVDSYGNKSKAKKGKFTVDTIAPNLVLKTPKTKKTGNGVVKATISWKAEKNATYTLTVDGEVIYSGKKTSRSLTLADGTHNYSVQAVDKAGNAIVQNGSFMVDATAPVVEVNRPQVVSVGAGLVNATFSWTGEVGVVYELKVGKKKYKNLNGTSLTVNGIKSGSCKYQLTAVDASGNKTVIKETIYLEPNMAAAATTAGLDRELELSAGCSATGDGAAAFAAADLSGLEPETGKNDLRLLA